MPPIVQSRPSRNRRLLALALLLFVAALLALAVGLLNLGTATRRNLEALVVTPAPLSTSTGAAPPLALPHVPAPAALPVINSGEPAPTPATILLLGADRRPGETATPRSDAILLVRLDPIHHRVALLSLPRDLWVPIPGHGSNRLNAAYLWGEHDGPPGNGLSLARATLSNLLDLPIDYVVMTDFNGFADLIDAMGGIVINVERPLIDTRFPTFDHGYTTVRFSQGVQLMDGATALTYARIRHPDSDFERVQRQQAVLIAIATRLQARGNLANLIDLERLSGALVGYVQTDMPSERMISLAWALHDLNPTLVERYALAEAEVSFGVENDRFAQHVAPEVLRRYARLLIAGP